MTFHTGQCIKCIDTGISAYLRLGKIYTIKWVGYSDRHGERRLKVNEIDRAHFYREDKFKLATPRPRPNISEVVVSNGRVVT